MTAQSAGDARLARCLACGGKIKVPAKSSSLNCPLCGLTLLARPGLADLPACVPPSRSSAECWKALEAERRLPTGEGATRMRSARLLMVPYWRDADQGVLSAADMTALGLPSLTRDRRRVAGLDIESRTRTGDAMGRLDPDAGEITAIVVDVTRSPGGGVQAETLGPDRRLVYYPVWSFHYVVYDKEHYHVVDATTARPIGPARRVRPALVAIAAAAPMLLVFLTLEPMVGPLAALPAWLVSLASTRLTMRAQRAA